MRTLVWFRADLRLEDNTALHLSARDSSRGVIGLFVVSPGEWRAHDYSAARVDLMLRSVGELSAALARLNIPLLVRRAERARDVPGVVLKAAKESGCDGLAFNREYELNESRRDELVGEAFTRAGITVRACDDQCLMAPGSLRTQEGRWYTVFTPFRKGAYAWLERHYPDELCPSVLPAPRKQDATGIDGDEVPVLAKGFEHRGVELDDYQRERLGTWFAEWPGGERAARKRLREFAASRVSEYKEARDQPGQDGTSGLSAALAIGTISVRQCLAAALEARREKGRRPGKVGLEGGGEGIATWISELLWREFYIHIVSGFPRVCMHRAFRPATERVRWNENEGHYDAWREGRTGIPIVDAGMRQLRAIGWMHNRVRMVTAMFLSKNLLLDWRLGERHFMNHLIDGFLASNNGGWQWSASTGTDAAPYFRVFNPVSQSQKFDASGEYIRTWVPELRGVDSDAIHEPGEGLWSAEYPSRPIVDLKESRARAIEAFRGL